MRKSDRGGESVVQYYSSTVLLREREREREREKSKGDDNGLF